MKILTQTQLNILEALATYRYLTSPQLLDLGISTNLNSIRANAINKLVDRKHPLIEKKCFGQALPGHGGKIPNVHCLTKYGVDMLAEYWAVPQGAVTYPTGGIQFSRDVLHRIATIDCHIRMKRWMDASNGVQIVSDWYFDKVGAQKGNGAQEAATRVYSDNLIARRRSVAWCEPDGIFGARFRDISILYVLEVHCFPDTGRITQQLFNHRSLILNQSVNQKYQLDRTPLVLSVHENEVTLKNVRLRLQATPSFASVSREFVFSTLEQVKSDITAGWLFSDGEPANPFPTRQGAKSPIKSLRSVLQRAGGT